PLLRGRVVLRAPRSTGLLLSEDVAPAPDKSSPGAIVRFATAGIGGWSIEERGGVWEATVDTGTIHPGGSTWTPAIYLGGTKSGEYELGLSVLAENLPQPLRLRASLNLDVRTEELSFEQLRNWDAGSPPL